MSAILTDMTPGPALCALFALTGPRVRVCLAAMHWTACSFNSPGVLRSRAIAGASVPERTPRLRLHRIGYAQGTQILQRKGQIAIPEVRRGTVV